MHDFWWEAQGSWLEQKCHRVPCKADSWSLLLGGQGGVLCSICKLLLKVQGN